MMRFILLSFLLLYTLPSFSWESQVRSMFFDFDAEKCMSQELYKFLSDKDIENNFVMQAYMGAALAASADCVSNPYTKLKRFRDGRKMIETALANEPHHPEIRFLRLSVQAGAPSFLNYSSEIEPDRNLILESFQKRDSIWTDNDFALKVLIFVRDYTKPDEMLIKQINELISTL